MSKNIAKLCILILMSLSTLGNCWFTFGIWPKSWFSFFSFFFIMIILMSMSTLVDKE